MTLNESGNKRGLHIKKMPFAFTEQGVAMLASVLRSETAIRVSLQIMDAFVEMRHYLMQNGGLVHRLSNIETEVLDQRAKLLDHDRKLDEVFEAMDRGELKDLGKNTFFFTKEEFTLEEVLKKRQKNDFS